MTQRLGYKSSQWISRSLKKAVLLEFLNCECKSKFSSDWRPKTFRKFFSTQILRNQYCLGRAKRKNWLPSNSKPSPMPVISDWKSTKEGSGPIHVIRAKRLGSYYFLRNDLAFATFSIKPHFIRSRQPEMWPAFFSNAFMELLQKNTHLFLLKT